MKTWAVFRELTWTQRRTLVLALVLFPVFGVLLRLSSPARLFSRINAGGTPGPGALASALALARPVNLVAARLRATCLTRSLVLHWILARRGIGPVLRIGVRNEDVGLHAHAWLECDGVPVNDTMHGVQGFVRIELP
jgi:Transglutaminase-like superfamily